MNRASAPSNQSEVLYSAQSFLTLGNLRDLAEQDVDFLELNRCFHLPTRTVQEEFIYHYFLYLHPYYPLIPEKDFWNMYLGRYTDGEEKQTMPLLVFQAMLFAASSVRLIGAVIGPIKLKKDSLYLQLCSRMLATQMSKWQGISFIVVQRYAHVQDPRTKSNHIPRESYCLILG